MIIAGKYEVISELGRGGMGRSTGFVIWNWVQASR